MHLPRKTPLLLALALAGLTLAPGAARADRKGFGFSAGVGMPLAPSDAVGGAVAMSVYLSGEEDEWTSAFAMRGELLGFFAEQNYAFLPTLGGEYRLALGRVDLLMGASVQLLGASIRDHDGMFNMFGFSGHAGFSIWLTDHTRICLRSSAIWIPEWGIQMFRSNDDGVVSNVAYQINLLTLEIGLRREARAGPAPIDLPIRDDL